VCEPKADRKRGTTVSNNFDKLALSSTSQSNSERVRVRAREGSEEKQRCEYDDKSEVRCAARAVSCCFLPRFVLASNTQKIEIESVGTKGQ